MTMNYIQLLERIHAARPEMDVYFEIGCRQGRSLTLSKARNSIGVDPAFKESLINGFGCADIAA